MYLITFKSALVVLGTYDTAEPQLIPCELDGSKLKLFYLLYTIGGKGDLIFLPNLNL